MRQIQSEIRNYIVENILFGEEEILKMDTFLYDSGIIDSTGFLEILAYVEESYCIEVDDKEVIPENFDTLQKIASFVEKKLKCKAIA